MRAASVDGVPGQAVDPGPETALMAAEDRRTLLAALGTLRDDDREILGARFFLDLSEAETAETLGLARGTVKSRTSRALARLRETLLRAEPDGMGGSMSAPRRMAVDDAALAAALRDLATAIDWPAATSATTETDLASRVAARLAPAASSASPAARSPVRPATPRITWRRPARRAVLLAAAAVLLLAAVAAAVGLGLPGIRIQLGGGPTFNPPSNAAPPSSPSAAGTHQPSGSPALSSAAPGAGLALGVLTPLDKLDAAAGRHIALPTDPAIGPPDAAWLDARRAGQVALVWAARPGLPETLTPGIGLILMSFDGTVADGYYTKVVDAGTTATPIDVGADRGFWIDGDPHFFFYSTADGHQVDDDRRWVGRALLWSDGRTTQRLETALSQADALRIAGSVR